MKALVCGAGGFIGGALVTELARQGHSTWSIIGRSLDLTARDACDRAVHMDSFDVVYICAGVTGGSGLIASDPLSLVVPNLLIHLHMFGACAAAGVRKVVCLSSTTGYPDTGLPMTEDYYFMGELHGAYFNPGNARRFIEKLGAMYPSLNVVFLRPSVVYGPGDNDNLETCHVIPALVRKVAERQDPIIVWGDGTNWRDGVYIDDMVRALVLAAFAPAGPYNIATGEGMTVFDILANLVSFTPASYQPEVRYDSTRPSMLRKRQLVTDKARDVLEWEPTVRMRDGLRRTMEAYSAR